MCYQEVDASPYYKSSESSGDKEENTPKRKIPQTPSVSQGATSAGYLTQAGDFWEDDEPKTTRRTKVSTLFNWVCKKYHIA